MLLAQIDLQGDQSLIDDPALFVSGPIETTRLVAMASPIHAPKYSSAVVFHQQIRIARQNQDAPEPPLTVTSVLPPQAAFRNRETG